MSEKDIKLEKEIQETDEAPVEPVPLELDQNELEAALAKALEEQNADEQEEEEHINDMPTFLVDIYEAAELAAAKEGAQDEGYEGDGSEGEELPDEECEDGMTGEAESDEEAGEAGSSDDAEADEPGEEEAGETEEEGEPVEEEPADPIAERMEQRKAKNSPEKRRATIAWLVAILIVAAAMYGATYLNVFTVTNINVKGNSYFTDDEIINMAHAELGTNLFHSTSTSEMIDYLEASPYITDAKIRRIIPGTINITVKERKQMGAVVYDNEYLIIDADGLLLRRTETRPRITVLTGIRVNRIEIGERLGATDEALFGKALALISAMDEGKVYFTEIDMSEMFIRAHIYDNLICVGTVDQVTDSITSGRLQKVLEELFSRGIKRGTINISDDGFASFNPAV